MDISIEYTNMCERAPKAITKPFSVSNHNTTIEYRTQILWCAKHHRFISYDYTCCPQCEDSDDCESDWIMLPRQDQLQDMSFADNLLSTKLFAFNDYWAENGIPTKFTSFEQLWLAFLMEANYNKTWNGEEWIT